MQKIRDYVERFFSVKKINSNYVLTSSELIAIGKEMCLSSDANVVFRTISMLFRYGYAKGYRAAKAEMKKGGTVA